MKKIQQFGIYYQKIVNVFNLFVSNVETREIDPFDKAGLFILKITKIFNKIDEKKVEESLCIAPKMVEILLSHLVNENYLIQSNNEYIITQKGLKALEEKQLYKQDFEDFEYLIIQHLIYVIPPYCYSIIERNFKEEDLTLDINFKDLLKNKPIYNIPEKWYNITDNSKQISHYYGDILLKVKLCFEESNEFYEFIIGANHIIEDHPELKKIALKFPNSKQISQIVNDYLKKNIFFDVKTEILLEYNEKREYFEIRLSNEQVHSFLNYFINLISNGKKPVLELLNNKGLILLKIPSKSLDWSLICPLRIRFESKEFATNNMIKFFYCFIEERRFKENTEILWHNFLTNIENLWEIDLITLRNYKFSKLDYKNAKNLCLYYTAHLISCILDFYESIERFQKIQIEDIDFQLIRTNNNLKEIKKCYEDYIKKAKEKIYIANFLLEDESIVNLLIDKFKKTNVRIYLFTNLVKNLLKYRDWIKFFDCSQDLLNNTYKNLEKLRDSGILIRGHEKLHAKFCIIDDKSVILSSANLERRSLNLITELGITYEKYGYFGLFISKLFIFLYDRIANKIFSQKIKFIETSKPFNLIQGNQINIDFHELNFFPLWTIDVKENRFNTKRSDRLTIYSHLLDLIRNCKKKIKIFTYSIDILNNQGELTEFWSIILEKIKNQNISVSVVLREKNFKYIKPDLNAFNSQLKNIKFLTHKDNHAKGIIIDDEHAIISSANFSEEFGLKQNIEVGWYFNRENNIKILKDLINFMEDLKINCKPEGI